MVMSRDQNAGQNHNINTGIKAFEMVKQFRYLGKNSNRSELHPRRNRDQIEMWECLLSFGA